MLITKNFWLLSHLLIIQSQSQSLQRVLFEKFVVGLRFRQLVALCHTSNYSIIIVIQRSKSSQLTIIQKQTKSFPLYLMELHFFYHINLPGDASCTIFSRFYTLCVSLQTFDLQAIDTSVTSFSRIFMQHAKANLYQQATKDQFNAYFEIIQMKKWNLSFKLAYQMHLLCINQLICSYIENYSMPAFLPYDLFFFRT